VSNLKQVGLAARLYGKYNRRNFPPSFLAMSNELGSPLVLHCPDDDSRATAGSWAQFTPTNSSYEFLRPGGKEAEVMNQVVFRCPVHGHLCFGSGKVLDATRKWAPVIESY
jgi:hypothetical protein